MHRVTLISLLLFIAPLSLPAQQPTAPHDSVRGAIRAVDARARTLEVTTGVGLALRIVHLQVPAAVPITSREAGRREQITLSGLKLGDVIRVSFGSRPTGFVAYTIERVGRMETGVESKP
jgi:hypothetical protein